MKRSTARSLTAALALALSSALSACGGPEGATPGAEENEVGEARSALASCFTPVRDHALWIGANYGTNFVSADVVAPGLHLGMWLDTQRLTYTPRLCLPGRACLPESYFYRISGTSDGNISVDSAGYMEISGVRITPSACSVPARGQSRIVGTDAGGRVYTVTLTNQYLG